MKKEIINDTFIIKSSMSDFISIGFFICMPIYIGINFLINESHIPPIVSFILFAFSIFILIVAKKWEYIFDASRKELTIKKTWIYKKIKQTISFDEIDNIYIPRKFSKITAVYLKLKDGRHYFLYRNNGFIFYKRHTDFGKKLSQFTNIPINDEFDSSTKY